MRRTIKIRGRDVSVKLLATLVACSVIGVVGALASIGAINIGYKITPTAQAPSLTPSTISLDLGSIPSGSTGTKDFGKQATLNLPVGYTITFTLDTTTVPDFTSFTVYIDIYESGKTYASYWISLYKSLPTDSETLPSGTYDLYIEITYTATTVTTTKTGTGKIAVSYPG